MSPSFLVEILCYTCGPFTITLASSAYICAGRCLILKSVRRPFEEGCMISPPQMGPLPQNCVSRVAQHVREEKEGKKENKRLKANDLCGRKFL